MSTIESYGTSGSAPKGSRENPYTYEEYERLNSEGKWTSAYVEGMGIVLPDVDVTSSMPGSGFLSDLWDWSYPQWTPWDFDEEQPGDSSNNNSQSGGTGGSGSGNSGGGGGNGGTSSNTSTPKQRAETAIDVFRRSHLTDVAYPNISKEKFAKALERHISNPSKVQQGKNGTCGAAVICKYLAEFLPDKYVKAAISLYRTGRYDEWGWNVAEGSKSGSDIQLLQWDPEITSVDAIMQGAIINTYNIILDYDPFTDGSGWSSFMWPNSLKNFFSDNLNMKITLINSARYQELSNINYDKYFVIAAIESSNWKDGQSEYTFTHNWPVPNHYIQVTGIYDDKGITFWHWGKDNNHSTNVDTYFIFKIQKP